MSTYSTNLKIELIGTGEQSGTWGATTNTNLGSLIEEAIAGYVTQAVTDGAATVLTIPNGTSSNGRNYVIELTGALTAARTVEVPAVDKPYIFFNNTTGGYAVTVKVSGQTGVTIANGKKAIVYTNSTDVIEVANAPVTEAGTQTLTNKTINGSSNTITNVSLTSGVTGTLPIANGGTGNTSASSAFNALSPITTTGDLIIGNGSNSATRLAIGANGYVLTSDGTTAAWAASTGGVTSFSAGTTGLTPSTGTTGAVTLAGTLGVANGGTGATSLTANNVILGNGTSAVQVVAPGTAGNVLTSNGTTWQSTAPAASGVSTGKAIALSMIFGLSEELEMANPNIVNVAAIYGNTSTTALSSTSATSIVSNAASSGKVYRINSLVVANVDGTNAADITINIYSAASLGGTAFAIASTISVPADASLIVIDKTTGIYLLEDKSIGAIAGAANDLVVTCSWEEINA